MIEYLENDTTSESGKLISFLDSLSLDNVGECYAMYQRLNEYAFALHKKGNDIEAVAIFKRMIDVLEIPRELSEPDRHQLLRSYIMAGASFSKGGMQGISLDYYMRGLRKCLEKGDDKYKAMLCNNIGVLYAEAKMHEKAIYYFKMALEINSRLNIHREAFLNYTNIAELYAETDSLDAAHEALRKSLDHLPTDEDPLLLSIVRGQQGDLYARQNQYDLAMQRYESELNNYKELGFPFGIVETYLQISKLYLKRSMADSAAYYASGALRTARTIDRPELVVNSLRTYSDICKYINETHTAVNALEEAFAITDSIDNAEARLRLNNLDMLDSCVISEYGSISDYNLWDYILPAIVVLLVIVLLAVLIVSRKIHSRQVSQTRIAEMAMSEKIDQCNRELTSLSLEKIKLAERMNNICEELRLVLLDLNPRETVKRNQIKVAINKIESLGSDNGDKEFQYYFEQVHPVFYKILSERFPELTARDLRLCAFIYLGLTTKEIAAMIFREIRSVESARNRLRKKLGIENSDDLYSFLHSIV